MPPTNRGRWPDRQDCRPSVAPTVNSLFGNVVAEHAFSLYDDQGVIEEHLGELHVSGGEAAFLNHVMDALWRDAFKAMAFTRGSC